MPVQTICVDLPPTFNGIKNAFANMLPPYPPLPTFGNLSTGDVHSPSFSFLKWLLEFMKNAMASIITTIMDFCAGILGLDIDDLLPKFPVLGFGFLEMLAMGAEALYEAIKNELSNLASALWDLLPSPIFPKISSISLSLVEAVGLLILIFFKSIVEAIVDIIMQVVDILMLVGTLEVPPIPSLSDIWDMLQNAVGDLLDAIADAFPDIPNPLFSPPLFANILSNGLELLSLLQILFMELIMLPINIIIQFCKDILGLAFPEFCIAVNVP